MFATAFSPVADTAAGPMCLANAGHPLPLHLQRRDHAQLPAAEFIQEVSADVQRCSHSPTIAAVVCRDGVEFPHVSAA